MGRDGASYQDTIARLEADIAKMKVTISEVLGLFKTPSLKFGSQRVCRMPSCWLATWLVVVWHFSTIPSWKHVIWVL